MNEQELRLQLGDVPITGTQLTFRDIKFSLHLSNVIDEPSITIKLPFPIESQKSRLLDSIKSHCVFQGPINIILKSDIKPKRVSSNIPLVSNIKNIIAIASGKGGVGKSTTAANLARALKEMGGKVGLLDADLYGPSQTLMMGVREQKPAKKANKLLPVLTSSGIEMMSMGFLIDDEQAVVWRGPMISKALQQLLFFTEWGELDYLIIDLPPGTGDTQLTLSQKIPVTAALVVTTPQEIALIDAQKAITMFQKVSIPVLGIVENMSHYICPKCHAKETIFGSDGGKKMAEKINMDLLGQIPLAYEIREAMDFGSLDNMHDYFNLYQEIAWKLAIKVAQMPANYSQHFTNIVVE